MRASTMGSRAAVVAVNLLATGALLAAIELSVRLFAPIDLPDPLITDERPGWTVTRVSDPLLFWRMRPHLVRDGEPFTNALGLRGAEVGERRAGEVRILSLGESTTFGSRLSLAATYSARLETALAARWERPVRVINAGVPGYTLFQGVVWLEREGVALDPDAVLVYFGFNDFLPVAYRRERDAAATSLGAGGVTDRELHRRRKRAGFRLLHALMERSHFVRRLAARRPSDGGEVERGAAVRVPEDDRRWLLERMAALAEAHRFRLVVVVPWYRSFERHAPLLRSFAAEEGIVLVDLPERFATLPRPRSSYFVDALHPTAEGHALIAEAIVDVAADALAP